MIITVIETGEGVNVDQHGTAFCVGVTVNMRGSCLPFP